MDVAPHGHSGGSRLPIYRYAIDWDGYYAEYPLPDVFADTVYCWPAERVRALQNERFLKVVEQGWSNPFYRDRWNAAGLKPGDVRSLDDIARIPTYTTEDVKNDQERHPPYGVLPGFASMRDNLGRIPTKLQTSGGTTGKPRNTVHGIRDWEWGALGSARKFYIQGVRPGDVMLITATCSLANLGWAAYKACHDYLGVLPITTGSGVVTPTRRQLEIAFDFGVNVWSGFPEYLVRLGQACREELGRDMRELGSKQISTFLGPDIEGTLRSQLEDLYGCPVYDNYGTNEAGQCAFECLHRDGRHFMEDAMFFEVLDTETNEPVAPGEVGNLVVTTFHRQLMPCIRFNLRDLGRIVATGTCECGSSFRRMDYFLGRSDSMVKLRGVNVYPMACLPAVRSDARTTGEWICEAITVDAGGRSRDEMIVHVEVKRGTSSRDGLKERLESRLKADLGVSVEVNLVDEGALEQSANLGEGKAKRLLDRRPAYAGRKAGSTED